MTSCADAYVVMMMKKTFASNVSLWPESQGDTLNCSDNELNVTDGYDDHLMPDNHVHHPPEKAVYAFITPFIIVIGVLGNAISLRIFACPRMRKLPASQYLAAISLSDLLVLITYVLFDWLHKGLEYWPGSNRVAWLTLPGFCQTYLFLSYTFRFTSAWLIVVFTAERFVAVCWPLMKRVLCTRKFSRRAILGTLLVAMGLSLYKPLASQSHVVNGVRMCSSRPAYQYASFVFDSAYGFIITAVPCTTITSFNLLILRKLLRRAVRHRSASGRIFSKDTRVRIEFTLILLAISTCFVCLNIPYFVVWCRRFLLTARLQESHEPHLMHQAEHSVAFINGALIYVTKTIFFFNYAVNFFLYCLTGKQYRQALQSICPCSRDIIDDKEYLTNFNSTSRCSLKNRSTSVTGVSAL